MRQFITDDRVAKKMQNILTKCLYHQDTIFYFPSTFQNAYIMTFYISFIYY
jgi:hypothetical protein